MSAHVLRTCAALLAATLWPAAPALAQAHSHAHEHGAVKLDVAVEQQVLTLALNAPLDSIVGFERAPRTDAEHKRAAEALQRLRDAGTLFKPDAAAACSLRKTEVSAPVLEAAAAAKPAEEHADLDATFEFTCTRPDLLRRLDVALFDAFRGMQRIDVQVAGSKAQSKTTLRRPARSIRLR